MPQEFINIIYQTRRKKHLGNILIEAFKFSIVNIIDEMFFVGQILKVFGDLHTDISK